MQALRSKPRKAEQNQQPSGGSDIASRLDVFPSESEDVKLITHVESTPPRSPAGTRRQDNRRRLYGVAAIALAVVLATAGIAWLRSPLTRKVQGTLRVETDLSGAEVSVDGTVRGKTPLSLALSAGDHSVRVVQGTMSRTLPVSIADRTTFVHHISWPAAEPAPPATGGIEIASDPRGQTVTVDGQARGTTPVTVSDLSPGEHEVVIRRDSSTVRRTVQVEAGRTASLLITSGAAGVSSGWLSVTVPISLQVFENGRLVGSTESDRILVPAGSHAYELVNEALGFRLARTVQVTAGQTTNVAITLPRGTINVNAVPWAQVWLDGQPLGETPIGNVSWTIGTHELVLRHPDLGERRVNTTITTGNAARVAVDMRKP